MTIVPKKDMVVLVADNTMKLTVQSLLLRTQSFGIRPIQADIFHHPEHDPGCRLKGIDFLADFTNQYQYALLMFDYEGSGENSKSACDLETELTQALYGSGWNNQATVLVIEPELDIWIWSDSPHVPTMLGWNGDYSDLRRWLESKGFWESGSSKPSRPKEAVEAALREVRKPRTSSLYSQLANKVSLSRCTDRAFTRFKSILQRWFREDSSGPSQTFA
jgi:hypothetical protein